MSEDFRFASAVAEFGLLLRDSPYKGSASFDAVIERASGAIGTDPNGHRKEFVELVRRAKGLTDRVKE
jgi:Ca-activated chloride channel family protein